MRDNDLLAVVKRRVKTTDSTHGYGRYPNMIRDYQITRPDQVWCADITYIQLQQGFVYLAIILDIFTRGLRGWNLGRSLSTELALTALQRALSGRRAPEIHHSDAVCVICAAHGYVERLQTAGVRFTMPIMAPLPGLTAVWLSPPTSLPVACSTWSTPRLR